MEVDPKEFEAEVLRVARARFAAESEAYQGSMIYADRERDGVFITEDRIVVIEATTSSQKKKAEVDAKKLSAACSSLGSKFPMRAVKGFLVTLNEPTADQRKAIGSASNLVAICSFAQFHAELINVKDYLAARKKYPFGSARDLQDDNPAKLDPYVQIDLVDESGEPWDVPALADRLVDGRRLVLTGDYGAGKSMTLRQVFLELSNRYAQKGTSRFPVLLNLRDHQGQKDVSEALIRHCRSMGFGQSDRMVRAFYSGDIHLLLDGFDEIATPGWLGRTTKLKDVRRQSVELIRKFLSLSPPDAGVLISGRSHFFDSVPEMRGALNLPPGLTVLRAQDYSDTQIREYLADKGWETEIPEWFPARPLLVGYLAARKLLDEVGRLQGDDAPAQAWHILLDRIAARESELATDVVVDGPLLRQILERLATIARSVGDGLGPLSQSDLTTAFREVCGFVPDEGSYTLLQRLPGLAAQDQESGSRHFIDESLVDALRAGDVVRFVEGDRQEDVIGRFRGSAVVMDALGVEVAAGQLAEARIPAQHVLSAARQLQSKDASDSYVIDLIRIATSMGEPLEVPSLGINGVLLASMSASAEADMGPLAFSDCIIQTLDLTDYDPAVRLPSFTQCAFGVVIGVSSPGALPDGVFTDCDFESFDERAQTTSGILSMDGLSPAQKVGLTVIKKLYVQRGNGRRESALPRGLDRAHKTHLALVLKALLSEGLAVSTRLASNTVYLPTREGRGRVRRMLEMPSASDDPFLRRLA